MRDPKTGLLRHGWDESKAMPWADKTTGLSPEVWGRAMGWYCMALVDVLDWFPADHPQRAALVAALNRNIAAVVKAQDPKTGLWWEVMDRRRQWPHDAEAADGSIRVGMPPNGNYLEASASCMFTYAIAKGVRIGYLPQADEANAQRAWEGIQKQFITTNPDGTLVLHGTVKVGGLGGTPYRAGDFAYYLKEAVVDQDLKGVGAFLLAGSEMDRSCANSKSARAQRQDPRSSTPGSTRRPARTPSARPSSSTTSGATTPTTATPSSAAPSAVTASPSPRSRSAHPRRARPSPDLHHRLARHPVQEPQPALHGQGQRRRHRGLGQGRRRPPALLQRPRQHRVHPLRHAQRPLRHPLQPGPLAPRRRRRPLHRRGRHPARHRHLRRRLHRLYEGHQHHHRQRPRQGRSSPTTATS